MATDEQSPAKLLFAAAADGDLARLRPLLLPGACDLNAKLGPATVYDSRPITRGGTVQGDRGKGSRGSLEPPGPLL
jgi:hypothetical protein